MKKLLLSITVAGLMTVPAAAATMFTVNTQFASTGTNGIGTTPPVAGSILTGAEASVDFSSGGLFNLINCTVPALCGVSPAVGAVTSNVQTFDATSSFSWNGGTLVYNVATWVLQSNGGGQFTIFTTGTYVPQDLVTYDPTPGVLNFNFGTPLTGAQSNQFYAFVATGNSNPVPEPGTMALLGSGLMGMGLWVARRRKAVKKS